MSAKPERLEPTFGGHTLKQLRKYAAKVANEPELQKYVSELAERGRRGEPTEGAETVEEVVKRIKKSRGL